MVTNSKMRNAASKRRLVKPDSVRDLNKEKITSMSPQYNEA